MLPCHQQTVAYIVIITTKETPTIVSVHFHDECLSKYFLLRSLHLQVSLFLFHYAHLPFSETMLISYVPIYWIESFSINTRIHSM